MIEVSWWMFLFMVFCTMGFYVAGFLYCVHWWLHKRPQKPSKLPATILRP